MKRILRSKTLWIVIIALVLIRIAAPYVILPQLNSYLAKFSPVYSGHVDRLGLSVFRGAYSFHGFELRLKDKSEERFFLAETVDISLAFRELFKGQITTDIEIDRADILLTNKVMNAMKSAPKETVAETQAAAKKLFPVRIERLDLRNSTFEFAELISIPDTKGWRVTRMDGRISNVTPTENAPLMFLTLNGTLFDSASIKMVAQLNQNVEPLAWDADLEVRAFQLKNANEWFKRKASMTFTSGALDIYGEARSLPDGIEGYVKPFLRNADVVAANESFSSFKHFGIELTVAAANLLLRTAKDQTMATKVLFDYRNGEFKINSAKAINDAIKNGFSEPLAAGIDDEIGLNTKSKLGARK